MTKNTAKNALGNGKFWIGDECRSINDFADTKAVAVRTRAIRSVKREIARLQIIHGMAVNGTGERQRVLQQLVGHMLRITAIRKKKYTHLTLCKLGGLFNRFNDAAERIRPDHNTVHHDFNGVLEGLAQLNLFPIELAHFSVYTNARKAFSPEIFKQLGILTLATQNNGSKHESTASLSGLEDLVGNLVSSLTLNHTTALRTMRNADTGIQKTQVIIDFRNGSNGRTGISTGGLLIDGNRRRKAVNGIKVGLIHLTQKLASIA